MIKLTGKHITLEPLDLSYAKSFMTLESCDIFRYFIAPPMQRNLVEFEKYISNIMCDSSKIGFAIILNETSKVIGSTCFMDFRADDRHVEIGLTWIYNEYRGTLVNPECKLLMLNHAFEKLQCEKVTLKCDSRNELSKNAILKLGAKYEGTLRRHKFTVFQEFRDTSFYSILKEEWPIVKQKLEQRLESN
jgi:N-acetyltransferase